MLFYMQKLVYFNYSSLNQWNSHILNKNVVNDVSFISSKEQALTLLHLMTPFVQVQELHSCSQVV